MSDIEQVGNEPIHSHITWSPIVVEHSVQTWTLQYTCTSITDSKFHDTDQQDRKKNHKQLTENITFLNNVQN